MVKMTEPGLKKRSLIFRYFFYLVSGRRLRSFKAWKEEGEPNPFVAKSYRPIVTERVEFDDLFEDFKK